MTFSRDVARHKIRADDFEKAPNASSAAQKLLVIKMLRRIQLRLGLRAFRVNGLSRLESNLAMRAVAERFIR